MTVKLSQKERMLLQDQVYHEKLCIEKYTKYANEAQDQQVKQIFNTHAGHEQQHYNTLNQILSGQVPSMGQNQQGQQNQATYQSPSGTAVNQNDVSLVNDMLVTEKYISGTYDTVIFECQDSNIRQVLNHIQKEEQQHGEDLFNYLNSKGMYNPQ